jgi:hypothetical protein
MDQGTPCPDLVQVALDIEALVTSAWQEHTERIRQAWERERYVRDAYGQLMYDARPPKPPSRAARMPRYLDEAAGLFGKSKRRGDWTKSRFWEHLGKPVLLNPEREFRNLTRMPKDVFDRIVEDAAMSGRWRVSKYESVAEKDWYVPMNGDHIATPLSLRVMLTLRHLATGESFSSLGAAGHICKETLRSFAHQFMEWFVDHYYADKVTGPSGVGFQTRADVEASEKIFRQAGLPGIVTSMDGVHVAWERAPYAFKHMYCGKEGYPTGSFNVHVLANGKIVYVAPGMPGASNDKTLVRFDLLVRALREDALFTDRVWRMHTRNGCCGVSGTSTLCDNGYHRWAETICGDKYPTDPAAVRWSARCESVRKNVERTFGILKVPFLQFIGACSLFECHL